MLFRSVEGPITSVYRWHDGVETSAEWRCTCKTLPDLRDRCLTAIVAGHDYEIPQIVIAELSASDAYAAWVRASVSGA